MHEIHEELKKGGSVPDEGDLAVAFKKSLKRQKQNPTTSSSKKRGQNALRHFAKYELHEDGLLYRKYYDTGRQEDVTRLRVPSGGTSAFWYNGRRYRLSLRRRLLLLTHDSCMGGGHPSIRETWMKIKEQGWWPTLYEDCVRWANGCAVCKLAKPQRVLGTDARMELHDRPFRILMVDGVGPISPPSPEGYTFLLHAEDPFSRFCWVRPAKANDGETVAKFLVEEVVLDVCGFPTILRTDRGTEYTATVVKEICDYFKVRQVFGSSYHPQSQGYIEARHKVINQVLRSYVEKYPHSWAKWARVAQWCMRATPRADRAGRSPYEIVTGLRPQGPIARLLERQKEVKLTIAGYVGALHEALRSVHGQIREGLSIEYERKVREREKEGVKSLRIQVGDTFFLRRGEGQRRKEEENTSFRLLPKAATTLYEVRRLKELTETGAVRTVSLCKHDDEAKVMTHSSVHVDRLIPYDIQALEAPVDREDVKIELVRRQSTRAARITHQNSLGSVKIQYDDDGTVENVRLEDEEYRFLE